MNTRQRWYKAFGLFSGVNRRVILAAVRDVMLVEEGVDVNHRCPVEMRT